MQKLVIYWEKDSSDLFLLNDVATITVGNDGMEVIVTDLGATQIREIIDENPDRLTLDTDEAATARHIREAMDWLDHARYSPPGEEVDIQLICQILRIADDHEIEHIIEAELSRDDCLAWHNEAEATPTVERLIKIFGAFQVWGMANPEGGEEPLRVIWPA